MRNLALASGAALIVQPLPSLALFVPATLDPGEPQILRFALLASAYSIVIAAAHLIVLGIPTLYLLRRLRWLSWLSVSIAGFAIGSLLISILAWPIGGEYSSSGTWHGQVREFVAAGRPTLFGWLQYAESVAFFGVHGLLGALAFFAVWRRGQGPADAI